MILFLFLVRNSKMKTRNSRNSSQAAIVSNIVKKKSSAMTSTERLRYKSNYKSKTLHEKYREKERKQLAVIEYADKRSRDIQLKVHSPV